MGDQFDPASKFFWRGTDAGLSTHLAHSLAQSPFFHDHIFQFLRIGMDWA